MEFFDLNSSPEEQEELLQTSIFWEMQTIASSLKNDGLDVLASRITTLEFYQLIKNHHLYRYDAITPCLSWSEYCVKVLKRSPEDVDAELLTLPDLCQKLNSIDAPQAAKDMSLINSNQRLCTLRTLSKNLLNVQASA